MFGSRLLPFPANQAWIHADLSAYGEVSELATLGPEPIPSLVRYTDIDGDLTHHV